MARIPEAEIERLEHQIALERLVESVGVKLARHGADLMGLCPLHDDREPSLVITRTCCDTPAASSSPTTATTRV